MKDTWAKDFPRLYELYRESDKTNEANYFAAFDNVLENPLLKPHYEQLEKELEQLDEVAWREFKQKVLRYVSVRDDLRGYSQLFDFFNEVKGYLYLKSEGCTEIHFIPEQKNIATPDLCARCGNSIVLLEVKTINKSQVEIEYIKANSELRGGRMQVREVQLGLGNSLERKIRDTVSKARDRLFEYESEGVERRIVYLVINLDIDRALDSRNFDKLVAYIRALQKEFQIEIIPYHKGLA